MRYKQTGIAFLCILLIFVIMGFIIHHATQLVHPTSISLAPSPSPSLPAQWMTISSPNFGSGDNELAAIAAVGAQEAWAVGFSKNNSNGYYSTLIEHWNGASWAVAPSPNAGNGNNFLAGITVVDAQNAWAVGEYQARSSQEDQALIERWNGTAWAMVPSPNSNNVSRFLFGVTAMNANDAWAVGESQAPSMTPHTLVEHWNGTGWVVVPSPNPGSLNNKLFDIAAVNASDVWAVGEFQDSSSKENQTLIEHWNGNSWMVVPSPNPSTINDVLAGISVVDAQDIWADGYAKGTASSQTLIEHWNGSSWMVVPSPNPGDGNNELFHLDAIAPNNVWTVGNYQTGSGNLLTLIERWNGSSWVLQTSPNPGNENNSLDGIAVVDAHHVLAVGTFQNSSPFQTLILQGGF